MNRYFFVVNPKSGSGASTKFWQRIHAEIHTKLPQMEYAFTQAPGHGSLLTAVALREGFNRIIAVGGDGTIGEVVNGFYQAGLEKYSHAALGFIPAGTGNDFCRSINVKKDGSRIIQSIINDRILPADLGLVSAWNHQREQVKKVFLNEASLGISSKVVQERIKIPSYFGSSMGFALSALNAARKYQNVSLNIRAFQAEDCVYEVHAAKCLVLVAANGQYFGGGLKIAPRAKFNDGKLDLALIGDLGKGEFLWNFPKVYFGKHQSHRKVHMCGFERLTISSEEKLLIEMDGEASGFLPAEIQVLPYCIQLIMP